MGKPCSSTTSEIKTLPLIFCGELPWRNWGLRNAQDAASFHAPEFPLGYETLDHCWKAIQEPLHPAAVARAPILMRRLENLQLVHIGDKLA